MSAYNLDADEAVILQGTGVLVGAGGSADLILTSKNIIQVNKGFFGSDKDSIKYPLSDLKVLNGKANVLIGRKRNGSKQLELFFSNGERYYSFNAAFAETKWMNAIIKAHKERMVEIEKSRNATIAKSSVLKSIAGSLKFAKNKIIVKKEPVNMVCKCPKCGAELTGNKGIAVKCSYCDTITTIK